MKKVLIFILFIMSIQVCMAQQAPVQSSNGRFVIFTSPHIQRATFLLDTRTGKTWQLVSGGEGYPYAWEQCEYAWYKSDGTIGGYSRTSVPAQ